MSLEAPITETIKPKSTFGETTKEYMKGAAKGAGETMKGAGSYLGSKALQLGQGGANLAKAGGSAFSKFVLDFYEKYKLDGLILIFVIIPLLGMCIADVYNAYSIDTTTMTDSQKAFALQHKITSIFTTVFFAILVILQGIQLNQIRLSK